MRVAPFALRYQGNGATSCHILASFERQLIALQLCRWQFSYNETLQQTFRPLLSKLSERRQIYVFDPHFEEVRGGVEPWLMARWKARVDYLLSVIELLFLSLTVEALQDKTCQTSLLSEEGGSLWAKISGGRGRLWRIFFWFLQNETHFVIWQCKLHRATCSRFDTIPACDRRTDRQTDGIAIASTALAMRALRRARCNKTKEFCLMLRLLDVLFLVFGVFITCTIHVLYLLATCERLSIYLWPPNGIGQAIIFLLCDFYLLSSSLFFLA